MPPFSAAHASSQESFQEARPSATVGAQVKLRGFRVELGEVEAALASLPGVQLAVALVLQDPAGAQQLVAYVTPAELASAALAAGLRERLPAHMVPALVVPLARMPLLPNEKIDRKALPAPAWRSHEAAQYVAPANELEAGLQAVWQQVLGRERISTADDFFAVGGNSLQVPLAVRLSLCAAGLLACTLRAYSVGSRALPSRHARPQRSPACCGRRAR